jgi:hypothetical protein
MEHPSILLIERYISEGNPSHSQRVIMLLPTHFFLGNGLLWLLGNVNNFFSPPHSKACISAHNLSNSLVQLRYIHFIIPENSLYIIFVQLPIWLQNGLTDHFH